MNKKIGITCIGFTLSLLLIMILMLISGFLTDNLLKFCVFAGAKDKISAIIRGVTFIFLSGGVRSLILFFALIAGWLYFRGKELFPKILIIWLWIAATGLLIYIIQILQMGPLWRFLIKVHLSYPIAALIFIVLWGVYLKKSQRVKQTFIHKLTKTDIIVFIFAFFSIIIFMSVSFYNEKYIIERLFVVD